MNTLRVSVLISTYNRAHLLPEALGSLLSQTRVPDEIIIVDDGSTDDTRQVLKQYSSPVKVIYQENQGLPKGRNTGIRAATGDLIAFLDSDDILTDSSIEVRARFLEQNPAVYAVYGATYMTNMQNEILGWFRKPPLPRGNLFVETACRVVFPMHSIMVRHECISRVGLFDDALPVQLDLDYWIRFCALYPVEAIDEPVAHYRIHDQMSIITQKDELIRKGIIAQQRVFDMQAFKDLSPHEQARIYSIHATQYALLGESSSARQRYLQAIQLSPKQPRNYLLWLLTFGGKKILKQISYRYNEHSGKVTTAL